MWGSDARHRAHPRDPCGCSRGARGGVFQAVLWGASHGAGEGAGGDDGDDGEGGEDDGKGAPSTAIQTHHGRD